MSELIGIKVEDGVRIKVYSAGYAQGYFDITDEEEPDETRITENKRLA